MHIDIRYNRGSGVGKGERTARRFEAALRDAGHFPRLHPVQHAPPPGPCPDLLVLVGGDGTVMHALGDAVAQRIPIYHVPLGNENLFARRYAMTREPGVLVSALARWSIDSIDLARVQPGGGPQSPPPPARLFAIMLSVGPDASVIHRMHRHGRSASGHLAYLQPVAEELESPVIVPITARVDGRTIIDARPGLLVVANLPEYAFGINPAADADPHDALLDLVFIPARTVGPLFRAALLGLFGRMASLPAIVRARGRVLEIDAPGGAAQVDGEALEAGMPLRIEAVPNVLHVLRV